MQLTRLKKWQLKALSKELNAELKRRYAKSGPAKYGQLNKGFTEQELALFLRHVENGKALTIFQLMAGLGLRVSEACSLKTADLDLPGRRLWVRSAKGSYPTMFYLHDSVYAALEAHRRTNGFGGLYLFPQSTKAQGTNRKPHLSANWVRKEFRKAVVLAGLDFCYAESNEATPTRQTRRLHRLTTHSLRHYFITTVRKKTGDLLLAQKLARHRDIRNTIRYTFTAQEEIDHALSSVFAKNY